MTHFALPLNTGLLYMVIGPRCAVQVAVNHISHMSMRSFCQEAQVASYIIVAYSSVFSIAYIIN